MLRCLTFRFYSSFPCAPWTSRYEYRRIRSCVFYLILLFIIPSQPSTGISILNIYTWIHAVEFDEVECGLFSVFSSQSLVTSLTDDVSERKRNHFYLLIHRSQSNGPSASNRFLYEQRTSVCVCVCVFLCKISIHPESLCIRRRFDFFYTSKEQLYDICVGVDAQAQAQCTDTLVLVVVYVRMQIEPTK